MTIFEELIMRVYNGENFNINFHDKTMKVGKHKMIDKGEFDNERVLIDVDICDMDDLINKIESIYQVYKYSTPSERSEKKRRHYFRALRANELTDEQLVVGERRDVAQAQLEGFVLCMILQGKFIWDEDVLGKWFWQSKSDSDLVILKDWLN